MAKHEEDTSMFEKIINDIFTIIHEDPDLEEFNIVHRNENKNKSPVVYEEHNLALESWCVKYVYKYLYIELFKVRNLLRKNRLTCDHMDKVNKLLVGALLIHPEVITFWNMRREYIQFSDADLKHELMLTKLVLSYKTKSNEALTYRKWILFKMAETVEQVDEWSLRMFRSESKTMYELAEKSQNNYHIWNHRVSILESTLEKDVIPDRPFYINLLLDELWQNMRWINKHISEHTGFHYRQYLTKAIVHNTAICKIYNWDFYTVTSPVIVYTGDNIGYLNTLLGKRQNADINDPKELLRCFNYLHVIVILLADLVNFMIKLNFHYPDHESLWYHRRFVVYHLLKYAYEYHDLIWECNFNKDILDLSNANGLNINTNKLKDGMQDNCRNKSGKIESTYLYEIVLKCERTFLKENLSDENSKLQKELAQRHMKWLKLVLHIDDVI